MSASTTATRTLDQLAIPYRVYQHLRPPTSLEEATRERGQLPEQVVRSILFRLGKNDFVLVLAAGPAQLSWPKLPRQVGGLAPQPGKRGGGPEGDRGGDRGRRSAWTAGPRSLLADEGVFLPEEVSIGSGVRGTAVILKSIYLKRALGQVDIARLT